MVKQNPVKSCPLNVLLHISKTHAILFGSMGSDYHSPLPIFTL